MVIRKPLEINVFFVEVSTSIAILFALCKPTIGFSKWTAQGKSYILKYIVRSRIQVSLVRKRSEEGSQEGDINSISRLLVAFLHVLKSLSFAPGWEETG